MRIGALEAGGTKMVCAIGDEFGNIEKQISIPTTVPQVTMPLMANFFLDEGIEALGIACFGPIDLNLSSSTYGYIKKTPKLAWANYDFVGEMKKLLRVPIGFDTDVNGSCLGEATFGQAKGKENVVYLTVGTGIGGGIISNGRLLHGLTHPETGHIMLKRHPKDIYGCKCPYHDSCFEGLAAGPAIEERWGAPAFDLENREEVWDMEAYYIAQALMDYILILSPEMIILGGGVMHQKQLFPLIRKYTKELLNGYIQASVLEDMDCFIVPASLNDNQGIMGALELGRRAANSLI